MIALKNQPVLISNMTYLISSLESNFEGVYGAQINNKANNTKEDMRDKIKKLQRKISELKNFIGKRKKITGKLHWRATAIEDRIRELHDVVQKVFKHQKTINDILKRHKQLTIEF